VHVGEGGEGYVVDDFRRHGCGYVLYIKKIHFVREQPPFLVVCEGGDRAAHTCTLVLISYMMCYSVLQCGAVRCSVVKVATEVGLTQMPLCSYHTYIHSAVQWNAVRCSAVHCIAVCCSSAVQFLQCVSVV